MTKYKFCTIKITKETRQHLKNIQFDDESYDDVILDILKTPNAQRRKLEKEK